MKTKLTLTVRKSVISTAKQHAKRTGKSISQMFEEFFENPQTGVTFKSDRQKAAERLLKSLQTAKTIPTLDDKQALKEHVARKFN